MKIIVINIISVFITVNSFAQVKQEVVQIEGYYTHGWEQSFLYELIDGNVKPAMWLEFPDKSVPDSLQTDLQVNGVFVRIEGIKSTGSNFGHLGIAKAKIEVTKIYSVDRKRTFYNHQFQQEKD
ncbi:MAG: hypothetical protein ACOH1O_02715 [Flavobacterium sp.]